MRALLRLLEDGRFHSGEELGAVLGVSRAAVWKQLQVLEQDLGIELHRVPGKGYRLPADLNLLNHARLSAAGAELGWCVHVCDCLDSTNLEAMRLLEQKRDTPLVVLTEQQTQGRGRRGRVWQSPFGQNLYFTLAVRIDGGMRQVEALSLTVGLAVARCVQAAGINTVGLKWPNDVLLGERKLAGILLELVGDPADICHVIIGVGINVNMRESGGAEIDQPWTSLREYGGRVVDRTALAIGLIGQLNTYIAAHWTGGFAALREQWEGLHAWQGEAAALISGDKCAEGEVLGVDASGALRMRVDGVECSYSGGELSLRLTRDS